MNSRNNVDAPFKAFFNINMSGDFMVAHNLPDMMNHVARAVTHDRRYRGYIVIVSGTMIVAEINTLGIRPTGPRPINEVVGATENIGSCK